MKLFAAIAVLTAAVFFTGCLDYEQTMVINKDGSGTIKMHYAIDKSFLEMSRSAIQEFAETTEGTHKPATFDAMLEKQSVESKLAESKLGIKLIEYAVSETDESQIWDLTFSFRDINNFWGVYTIFADDEFDDGEDYDSSQFEDEIPDPIYSKQSDGSWLFRQSLSGFSDDDEEEDDAGYPDDFDYSDESGEMDFPEMTLEQIEQMKQMGMTDSMIQAMQTMQKMASKMKDNRIRFKVTLPGKIIESNAHSIEGNTAIWDFGLAEMSSDSLVLRAVVKP